VSSFKKRENTRGKILKKHHKNMKLDQCKKRFGERINLSDQTPTNAPPKKSDFGISWMG
jgi:hypothetical protein